MSEWFSNEAFWADMYDHLFRQDKFDESEEELKDLLNLIAGMRKEGGKSCKARARSCRAGRGMKCRDLKGCFVEEVQALPS